MVREDAVDFETGKRKVIEAIGRVESKPILVGVFGTGNSGKSYLIGQLGDYFRTRGFEVGCGGSAPGENIFERIRGNSWFDYSKTLFLLHCGWSRSCAPDGSYILHDEDPGVMAKRIIRRDIDLAVGIYRPQNWDGIDGEYDVVIRNPDAVKKPSLTLGLR